MKSWDEIYQHYQQGGEAWATLNEGIDPRFIALLQRTHFPSKRALDIGCGTGKYLSFLEKKGFTVDGIDSSPTAIEMTKKEVSQSSKIQLADMYAFEYPMNEYDLILSVSTLHHGTKKQVKHVIGQIYGSVVSNGTIFITLPNFDEHKNQEMKDTHVQLETGTYAPHNGPEEGIPHSFFTEAEIRSLFSEFIHISLDLDEIGRWFIIAGK